MIDPTCTSAPQQQETIVSGAGGATDARPPLPLLPVMLLILVVALLLLACWRKCRIVFSLDDRVVLITGAGSGIGRRLAQAIAARAARVTLVLLDIDLPALEAVRAQLLRSRQCHRVLLFECDVSDDWWVSRAPFITELYCASYLLLA